MAKKNALGKLNMPKKLMAEEEAELDLGLEEMPEDEELEMSEGMDEDMEMEDEDNQLSMFSDEEIMEELKLRGLSEAQEVEPEDEEALNEPEMMTGNL